MSADPHDIPATPAKTRPGLPRKAMISLGSAWAAVIVSALAALLVHLTGDGGTAVQWLSITAGLAASLVAGYDTALRALESPRARPSWDTLVGLAAAWLVLFSLVRPGDAWVAPAVLALHRTMTWMQHGNLQRQRRALEDPVSLIIVHVVPVLALVAIPLDFYALGTPVGPAVAAVLLGASPRMHAFSRLFTLKQTRRRARDLGIRVKRRATLFQLRPPMTLVFVPEGTLFQERPALCEVTSVKGKSGDEVIALAAAWALLKDAPESESILEEAHRRRSPVREARNLRSFGELGIVFDSSGRTITLGTARLLRDRGISLSPLDEVLVRVRSEGRRPLLIARDRELLGAVVFEDHQRRDTVRTIKVMQRLGMRCAVLTGHPAEDYRVLAEKCGIARVLGDVDPEDRHDALDTLRGETIYPVALVTPRLDEPAMRRAAAGIYFKPGESDWLGRAIALVGTPGLLGIAWLYLITEAARITHAWGIAWTIGYHAGALLLAMTGWLHPFAAAVCAHLAWLLLLVNANRMCRFNPDKAVAGTLERRVPYQPR